MKVAIISSCRIYIGYLFLCYQLFMNFCTNYVLGTHFFSFIDGKLCLWLASLGNLLNEHQTGLYVTAVACRLVSFGFKFVWYPSGDLQITCKMEVVLLLYSFPFEQIIVLVSLLHLFFLVIFFRKFILFYISKLVMELGNIKLKSTVSALFWMGSYTSFFWSSWLLVTSFLIPFFFIDIFII